MKAKPFEPVLEVRIRYGETDPKPWRVVVIYHSGKSEVRWYKTRESAWRRWYLVAQDLTA